MMKRRDGSKLSSLEEQRMWSRHERADWAEYAYGLLSFGRKAFGGVVISMLGAIMVSGLLGRDVGVPVNEVASVFYRILISLSGLWILEIYLHRMMVELRYVENVSVPEWRFYIASMLFACAGPIVIGTFVMALIPALFPKNFIGALQERVISIDPQYHEWRTFVIGLVVSMVLLLLSAMITTPKDSR